MRVSYNPATKEIINVDILNIADGGKYMYKIPVPIQDVKAGDIVVIIPAILHLCWNLGISLRRPLSPSTLKKSSGLSLFAAPPMFTGLVKLWLIERMVNND